MGSVTTDWLSQLAPAHAPAALGWWPPAPGWWMLALLLLAGLAAWLIYYFRAPQRMRRTALRELDRLSESNCDDIALARGIAHLLRRYAVVRFGREAIALLSGEAWLAFLVAHGAKQLDGATGSNLLRLAYGGKASADRMQWLAGARAFLKDKS